jgi:hypothetical protein
VDVHLLIGVALDDHGHLRTEIDGLATNTADETTFVIELEDDLVFSRDGTAATTAARSQKGHERSDGDETSAAHEATMIEVDASIGSPSMT